MDNLNLNPLLEEAIIFEGLVSIIKTRKEITTDHVRLMAEHALKLQSLMKETGLLSFIERDGLSSGSLTEHNGPLIENDSEENRHSEEMLTDRPTPHDPAEEYDSSAEYNIDDEESISSIELVEDEEEHRDLSPEGKLPDLSYFTIVEKVNYRSTLFDGNKSELEKLMKTLAGIEGFSAASIYLKEILHWHPDTNDHQATFLAKLHECYCQGTPVEK